MIIRKYEESDINKIFELMKKEGEEWEYAHEENQKKYIEAMNNSITYVIFYENILCGYIRCKDDHGFGIYILDLLVDEKFRGRSFGKKLMDKVCDEYPNNIVYVLSDVDEYYIKQGFGEVGTVFKVIG